MRRWLVVIAVLVGVAGAAPAVLAAEPLPHTGRIVLVTQGDVDIPAGDHADAVVVIEGTATIRGTVNTLLVVNGSADLQGARLESMVAIGSSVELRDGTVITGELQRLDAAVHQSGNVQIQGGITDLRASFLEVGAVLGPALILIWLGFGLATIGAALLLAGVAGRQVREATRLIGTEPLTTGVTGLVAIVTVPIAAILLIATLIGAPTGLAVLVGLLPVLAFGGYLVGGTWLGAWILGRSGARRDEEHPYLAALVGVLVLMVLGLVPVLALVSAVVSLLGLGAVIRIGFAALRGHGSTSVGGQPLPAPSGA